MKRLPTLLVLLLAPTLAAQENPILFVTQVPIPADFATVTSTFANHRPDPESTGRGGDLWIRYPDGELRNLTREAGLGREGFQGRGSIAVRDPAVHWSGDRALFALVEGAPERQYRPVRSHWQIYEVRGLSRGEPVSIRRVPGQPRRYNNVSPTYLSDDSIGFVSDRPRDGRRHLYPQRDEYESTPCNSGVWRLEPGSRRPTLLEHSPSGSFDPFVDSFGRLVFTRWDHLQRDQQADAEDLGGYSYGSFDYRSEAKGAGVANRRVEVFPEPRPVRQDLLAGTPWVGHRFNHFFPWTVNQDGTGLETLNHLGRHELHAYFERSRRDDPSLRDFFPGNRKNRNSILNLFQITQDPTAPQAGRYLGVEAPEFDTHGAGRIVSFRAPPGLNPDRIRVESVTHPDSGGVAPEGSTAPHPGHFRDPLPLLEGRLLAAYASEGRAARNEGDRAFPVPRYQFRLVSLEPGPGGSLRAGEPLVPELRAAVSWWDPDVLVTWDGPLWQLSPVEVVARSRPPSTGWRLAAPETEIFAREGVDPAAFRAELRRRDLALLVTRDVTTRDRADRQQPVNLAVAGSGHATHANRRPAFEVAHLQILQGDLVRGIGGEDSPAPGRRVLARPLHDDDDANPDVGGPEGSVEVASDGSIAAFVPARRALSWQLVDPGGEPVVRERYWISLQAGEIRACDGCHGVNRKNQAGDRAARQPPEALRALLRRWKQTEG